MSEAISGGSVQTERSFPDVANAHPGYDLTLLVAGPGAHHAFAAAEFGTAAHRGGFGPADMGLDGPAEAAARVLGVDRDCGATLAHVADQLAGAAGALLDRGSPG